MVSLGGLGVACDSSDVDESDIGIEITLDKPFYEYDETPVVTVSNLSSDAVVLDLCSGQIQGQGDGFWVGTDLACTFGTERKTKIGGGDRESIEFNVGTRGTYRVLLDIRDVDGDLLPEAMLVTPPIVMGSPF